MAYNRVDGQPTRNGQRKYLSDCNWTRTHNHLVHKRTLNHLAKLAKCLSKEFLDIQATIECGFTLKRVRDMIRTYSQGKYYLPRIDLNKYSVIIDGWNFYYNPIESDIEKYRELKKVMIGKGEDYTTGFLLDYNYFKKHNKLVAVDLSKQKELDADPRAIQQIEFKYTLGTNSTIYWILENLKKLY